jgi:hypothetical protein
MSHEKTPQIANATRDLGLCVCGKRIYEAVVHHAWREDVPAVIHEMPYCQKFLDLELVEYLRYVRRSRGITEN